MQESHSAHTDSSLVWGGGNASENLPLLYYQVKKRRGFVGTADRTIPPSQRSVMSPTLTFMSERSRASMLNSTSSPAAAAPTTAGSAMTPSRGARFARISPPGSLVIVSRSLSGCPKKRVGVFIIISFFIVEKKRKKKRRRILSLTPKGRIFIIISFIYLL